nr:PhnD/SsuA/transferrin family substrate-binding protein [Pseudomonas sp.]
DTRIHSLDQLRGSSVSLVDPASTSGGIVPRAMLQRTRGMPLEAWFGRVSFAGSHDAAIDVVLNGRVDAAFVSSSRVDGVVRSGRVAPDTLHVVWRSDPIPHDPFVYQADLCQPVKDAIHRVFFERQDDLKALFVSRGMGSFVSVSESDYQHLMQRPIDVP